MSLLRTLGLLEALWNADQPCTSVHSEVLTFWALGLDHTAMWWLTAHPVTVIDFENRRFVFFLPERNGKISALETATRPLSSLA